MDRIKFVHSSPERWRKKMNDKNETLREEING